jgi:hypothetical protein
MTTVVHSFYVVLNEDNGKYFAGYNAAEGKPNFVDDPLVAKPYSNKFDILLRPNEKVVELKVQLSKDNVELSAPFRPRRRVASHAAK